ncbi:hypothetical protein ACWER9_04505 [Micromonospora sp. NPDC003944]
MNVTAIGLRIRRRGAPLHSEWHGATAVISHPLDQPLDLWRLLRAEAPPDILVVPSDRALREPGCATLLRAVVQEAAGIGGTGRVWLAADRVGRPDEAYAPWLTDLAARTGLELLAPDGPVVAVPGGTRYAAGGTGAWGWRSFRGNGGCPVSANRCPTPAWEPALPDRPATLGRLVADPVPAGMLLRAATSAPAAAGDPAYRIPVDPRGPVLALRNAGLPPVPPADVAALFAGLPAHFPVRVETALLDPSDVTPEPAWFDALAALLGGDRLPEPTPIEPAWETVPVIRDGWCRVGDRLYRHQTVPGLLAEVVPSGVLLRREGGYGSPDLAFVDPVAGQLVWRPETSPAMLAAVRQAGGSTERAIPDDPPVAPMVAEPMVAEPPPARPTWARAGSVALTLPLPPRPVAPPVIEPDAPQVAAGSPAADPLAPDPPLTRTPVDPERPRSDEPAPPPNRTQASNVEPVLDEPAPPLRLAGIGPIPAMRTISGPDVADAPVVDEEQRWVRASAVPVPDRPSTLEEQSALAAAMGAAFDDSITTVNAALAAWPALRQDIAAAEKSDLVAVRAFLGQSGASADEVNAAVRAGRMPTTPGYLPCLVSGLRRLPPCRRAVVGQGRLGVPARRLYAEGTTLVEPAFRSVSARTDVATEEADVDFLVWSRTARQLGAFAEHSDLDEAVFLAGSRFKVLAIRDEPNADRTALPATVVLLRELLPSDTESDRALDDDRAALRRLDRALDRRRSSVPRLVTDARTAGRLAGPPLGFVDQTLTTNASLTS